MRENEGERRIQVESKRSEQCVCTHVHVPCSGSLHFLPTSCTALRSHWRGWCRLSLSVTVCHWWRWYRLCMCQYFQIPVSWKMISSMNVHSQKLSHKHCSEQHLHMLCNFIYLLNVISLDSVSSVTTVSVDGADGTLPLSKVAHFSAQWTDHQFPNTTNCCRHPQDDSISLAWETLNFITTDIKTSHYLKYCKASFQD